VPGGTGHLKLLLDAHVSDDHIAEVLRGRGYDVEALIAHPEMEGWTDDRVLGLAAEEGRIVVTFNHRHFVPLAAVWYGLGKHHAGIVTFADIKQNEFGLIIERLEAILTAMPDPDQWMDACIVISRPPPDVTG
jgi:predicted nuclease of predicted toxin-antitoxin system